MALLRHTLSTFGSPRTRRRVDSAEEGVEMKTILVTGATGILGSNVCVSLIEKGYRARAIARNMDAADVKSLKDPGVDVVPGDVTDLPSMRRAAEGVDSVIHS